MRAGPNEVVLIGAETAKKARALHWQNLHALVVRHELELTPNRTDGSWSTPWGATIVFWGIKDENAVELLRGFKVRAAYFDEVATYDPLLENLCEKVLEPALGDTGGTLTLCGTPTVTRAGYWFEVCERIKPGWSVHHWTVLQNPMFPRDARAWLASVLAKNGWTEDNATFQREYMGRFVNDTDMQVYRYVADANDVHALPEGFWEQHKRGEWLITLGVDFGMRDSCAWVVLGSHRHKRDVWVLSAHKQAGLLTDEAARITASLCETWRPDAVVGDSGGLGKPYVEEWNRRHAGKASDGRDPLPGDYGMPAMLAANKLEKLAHIALVNGDLIAPLDPGTGARMSPRTHFVQPACKPLTSELQVLPWADATRAKEHPAFENHCADAYLYASTKHRAYLHEAPAPRLADRDPDEAMAWLERQEAEQGKQAQQLPDWARF